MRRPLPPPTGGRGLTAMTNSYTLYRRQNVCISYGRVYFKAEHRVTVCVCCRYGKTRSYRLVRIRSDVEPQVFLGRTDTERTLQSTTTKQKDQFFTTVPHKSRQTQSIICYNTQSERYFFIRRKLKTHIFNYGTVSYALFNNF